MKRWEIVCASVGVLLLLASAWAIHRVELPRETFTLSAAECSMPITVIEPSAARAGLRPSCFMASRQIDA